MSAEPGRTFRLFTGFALVMLLAALVFGTLAAFVFVFPDLGAHLPFEQLRPMHVSAALFWIITGATAGVMHYKKEVFGETREPLLQRAFMWLWMITTTSVFVFYAFRQFGGREYWEFPPLLGIPVVFAWMLLMVAYLRSWARRTTPAPLYVWMWTTGIFFFLFTFIEQNLYLIPWFRDHYLREITVQWKSNGAMVGAWNQMIYGTALYLMVKISGDENIARGRTAFLFWLLGLSNLMFNWGHHLYNVPGAGWIRHTAYVISMTEFAFFIAIVQGFKRKLEEHRKYKHLLTYRFLIASEAWVLLNLILVLLMSVPAINRYTHGTHITVAHAMGATIGINSMILLASLGYMLRVDELPVARRHWIARGRTIALFSLLVFWCALIAAGMLKGYRDVALGISDFQQMMRPVFAVLKVFALAGLGLLVGIAMILRQYLGALYAPADRTSNTACS